MNSNPPLIPDYSSSDEEAPKKLLHIPRAEELLKSIANNEKIVEVVIEKPSSTVIADTTKEGKKIQAKLLQKKQKTSVEKFEKWVNTSISNNRVIKNVDHKPKKAMEKIRKKRKIVTPIAYASECYQMLKTVFE